MKKFSKVMALCALICVWGGAALLSVSCSNNSNSSNNNGGGGSGNGGGSGVAYQLGDIIFSDGSKVSYSADLTLTQAQKDAAVAVIFDAAGKKGVGLNECKTLTWAPKNTTGYNTEFNTSDSDGKGNWTVIQAADPVGAANASTNYPAFNFCNTYGVEVAGDSSGWYLPALEELRTLLKVKNDVIASIGKIGTNSNVSLLTNMYLWSSSQVKNRVDYVYADYMGTSLRSPVEKDRRDSADSFDFYVRAIRVFN